MIHPPEIKRALRIIVISQYAGMIGPLLFSTGFMLAYILRLGVPAYRILFLFAAKRQYLFPNIGKSGVF